MLNENILSNIEDDEQVEPSNAKERSELEKKAFIEGMYEVHLMIKKIRKKDIPRWDRGLQQGGYLAMEILDDDLMGIMNKNGFNFYEGKWGK